MSSESTQADALREFDVVALLAGDELEVEFVQPSREPTPVRLHRSDLLKLHGLRVGAA